MKGLFESPSINDTQHNNTAIKLSVSFLFIVMLNVNALSDIILNVVILNGIMLSVVMPVVEHV
jgi:hypothetical protein